MFLITIRLGPVPKSRYPLCYSKNQVALCRQKMNHIPSPECFPTFNQPPKQIVLRRHHEFALLIVLCKKRVDRVLRLLILGVASQICDARMSCGHDIVLLEHLHTTRPPVLYMLFVLEMRDNERNWHLLSTKDFVEKPVVTLHGPFRTVTVDAEQMETDGTSEIQSLDKADDIFKSRKVSPQVQICFIQPNRVPYLYTGRTDIERVEVRVQGTDLGISRDGCNLSACDEVSY